MSLYNGTRGIWRLNEEFAERDGERHERERVVQNIHKLYNKQSN